MDLRNWEFFASGSAVSGANVYLYTASLSHPNLGSVLTSTITDSSGFWQFTSLSDGAYDVRVSYNNRDKWYKGLTRVSVGIQVGNLNDGTNFLLENPDLTIFNGNFNIWPEKTTFTSAASGTYGPEQFCWVQSSSGVVDMIRATDVPAVANNAPQANYSLHIDVTTADASVGSTDVARVELRLEGYAVEQFVQRQWSFGFWVKSGKTGVHCVSLRNSGSDRYFIAEYTVNVVDTWEYKTIVVPASPTAGSWDYSTGLGLAISWVLMAGSSNQGSAGSWQTGSAVATANQVNVMDSASNNFKLALVGPPTLGTYPALFRHPNPHLARDIAQRFFEKGTPDVNVYPTANDTVSMSVSSNSIPINQQYGQVRFQVPKRTPPVVTIRPYTSTTSSTGVISNNAGTDQGANSGIAVSISDKQFGIQNNTAGAITTGANLILFAWDANARL